MEKAKTELSGTPMLFPYDPEIYWNQIRVIIREEIKLLGKYKAHENIHAVSGLTYKPLLKIAEVCNLFQVSRTTLYEWIKHGKLKPYRVRKSVYFLWNDIQELLPM